MVRANTISLRGTIRPSGTGGQVTISRACWPRLCSGVPYVTRATPDLASERPVSSISVLTRRSALLLATGATVCATTGSRAAEEQIVTVHKDPSCGCCSGWVRHLRQAGFIVKTIETADLDPVKTRLGVPNDLAACHTAQIGGYVIEGHVPAVALKRFLNDKPSAIGLPFLVCRSALPAWREGARSRTTS
jgi:hypothetical protein